ncbi:CusA/CzcA family heavy metal efflux RND transporter [Zobellia galactanivorans]|uniref:CusA/CzcA family heavy metal efflux RND transporter n=1 Tax=Zobellia galactanivorans (strain DSM 12802 / CCUG 47099 / CIP 106680 / NCIMB 13871 / Dsij) TaxID=63186 RepID=UPI0026E40E26|nr:CusA/CzcA family heavy metal efflux RND transporter [Zobellia galactanivorans]MDO6808621.1 CusA/CzcA family heavy metal efflux RND transporter [Zobellia galactanivorans]
MLSYIINFSIRNKLIVLLFTSFIIGFGLYSLTQIPIGAVPDVTNNQVQVITTSRNLSTQDIEQFITYPIELEMANLPGVQEIRSISKFGLSVVTIVFDDDLGTYLPRQLIAEKIKSASEKIPDGFGVPEMGPITTGLGEIYQYILDVKPEFKDRYSIEDLRTIQDWVVKRQLSGIPGVVEVNTWGGFLKQYEVAINTEKLNAMNITAQEVFNALEANNSVTGGGYIEKVNQAYFIRGEGLITSLDDIGHIVVKNEGDLPIYIKDVASVGFGSATRFGAITGNGQGEKVLGQVMMLKDANSKKVIEAVKERVASISKSLPEGVYINAFLDRSELIAKTTFTVSENLILGCLIVIFVVVLLLGNFRSGLVVASVIPLCLLFALSLMYVFGVDANLMSLGAIDFGIIIDGAVIIVEFIAFQITRKKDEIIAVSRVEQQRIKDRITVTGASKMMNSAIFGQLIILIVFIPILSLSGVEGKMFKPMALTFSFALIGAMLLCFTYVPVAASLFLKPSTVSDKNISVRIMKWLMAKYEPIIHWALHSRPIVLGIAALLLAVSVFLYSNMGGEFVPTLDEGDFVIQPVLKTGTSLSNTVKITTEIEKILLDKFPEVKQVVTRIGAAEVPTDPMSMEESDVIIVLKPKSEWTSADSKDELADRFKEALAVIPGMEVEFTQPIEMRFNELITGVRADIAIKIFGDDLDILAQKGNEIGALIEKVDGAADISVEKIAGLPEMNVKFNRAKIARYGLNIQEVNDMVSMGFAGRSAGNVFEGERRFDLVVRLDKNLRQDIDNLKNLYIDVPRGGKVPLSELADITYQKGAAKISRDDTKRRIVVGVNVRNRDLQSVVDDVQRLINENISLPVGYTIAYGGQFENLQSAKSRLLVAVPIALILIFVLLYFAFSSVKEALMIYSAIPLAAVGGVLLLWLRGLPFSISAGVGFIALFGIAVLNGIVLIEHFKELEKEGGYSDINELIKHGAIDRLRAVLLTAMAAALGFLPMAISTNAGAEVQRPLATVVIGGLITATLLTLVVLPVLYAYFHSLKEKAKPNANQLMGLLMLFGLMTLPAHAQQAPMDLENLITTAVENNAGLNANRLEVEQSHALINSAFSFDKTQVYYEFDENNLAANNEALRVYGVQQDFRFPTVYFSERKVNKANHNLATSSFDIKKKALERKVTAAYYTYQIAREKEQVLRTLDSLYSNFSHMAARRFELGETNYLEKITAASKQKQINIKYLESQQNVSRAYVDLTKTVQSENPLKIANARELKVGLKTVDLEGSSEMEFYQNRIALFQVQRKLEKQRLLPDISLNYFQGTNSGLNSNLYGYQLGVKIPLLFGGQASKIKAAGIAEAIASEEFNEYEIQLTAKYRALKDQMDQLSQALTYYEEEGSALSDEILKTANGSFKNGEVDFYQYIQSLESAYEVKLDYLDKLEEYNGIVIAINYLTL